ncbi:MAG: arsenate reductase ArsC [Pirellulaceae bacterium]|nr:arsenate reductase ArsC [Pirellulaceae bacterium]
MRIIFLCVENSNRSQMAEAWGRIHAPAGWEIYSAGSKPSGKVNPKAVAAMQELGYDMAPHRSKGLDDVPGEFDVAITMGCGDSCPTLKAAKRIDWQIPDPKVLSPEEYREVRNLIGRMVQSLVAEVAAR